MKPTNRTINWLIVFVWSIFMGITFISIGIGALVPQLNDFAGPLVCPQGQIQVASHPYQVSPVESGYTLTYYCVDHQTGVQTELAFWPKHIFAGAIYGLLIFFMLLGIWIIYNRWAPTWKSPEVRKWMGWIQAGIIVVIVGGVTLFNLSPLFRSLTPIPTSTPDAAATSVALTFQALSDGKPRAFNSTDKPLSNWNGIPIMPQAIAGQQVNDTTYAFRVKEPTGTVESFYKDNLKSQGWTLEESRWLGMKFAKDQKTLLVTLAPAIDLNSFIVTLVLVP